MPLEPGEKGFQGTQVEEQENLPKYHRGDGQTSLAAISMQALGTWPLRD